MLQHRLRIEDLLLLCLSHYGLFLNDIYQIWHQIKQVSDHINTALSDA